jgi:hypothetical protein
MGRRNRKVKHETSNHRPDINLNNSKVINLGITAAAIWMRFSIDSGKQGKEPDPAHRKWYLDF